MSSLENTPPPGEPDKDKYLTQPEREQLQRLLSQPEEFPRELGSWITDYVGTNAFLQKSQVQGLPLLNTQVAQALETLETTVEALAVIGTTYSDEVSSIDVAGGSSGTAQGPSVTVPAGTYYCTAVGTGEISSGAGNMYMRMWNTPDSAVFGSNSFFSETSVQPAPGSGPYHALISIGTTTLSADGDISMWAAEDGNGNRFIYNAALVAVRTA